MSIDFYVLRKDSYEQVFQVTDLNMANVFARELLEWLSVHNPDLWSGQTIPARELAALCRRRLWPESRNDDPAQPSYEERGLYYQGRPAGYLKNRTQQLLDLCEKALREDEGARITWG